MKILLILSISFYFVTAKKNDEKNWCSCGLTSARIINGTVVPELAHPWSAALMTRVYYSYRQFCGGSVITPRHVLTAAHCLEEEEATSVWVAVGQHKISKIKKKKLIRSKDLIIHENYDDKNIIYDIALVVTSRKMKYTPRVRPICLPKSKLELENQGAKVTVAGWGCTTTSCHSSSDVLRQVELDVVPLEECARIRKGFLFLNQLCTHGEGKSAFIGDSGSPVIWKNPKTGEQIQVGLVSYGDEEALLPSLETDVTAYIDWIEDKIEESTPGQSICTGK